MQTTYLQAQFLSHSFVHTPSCKAADQICGQLSNHTETYIDFWPWFVC